ncbi:hypothetical protein Syun_013653 [Stephania yunnanensis]|uniref:Uncharacterized protein n=1 Tax=Stephania yunnanensis TaxID=152371 RepID=A0AAP0JHS7_9MAGN
MANKLCFFIFGLCFLPALAMAARPVKNPFIVHGKVFCDTCRAGFETYATTYVPGIASFLLCLPCFGAKVRVECRDSKSLQVVYNIDGVTDSTGTYQIQVADDHGDQLCESVLLSSPERDCATIQPGRDRARVILTNNNGIVSNYRYANSLGFVKDAPLAGCEQVLKQYQEHEEQV